MGLAFEAPASPQLTDTRKSSNRCNYATHIDDMWRLFTIYSPFRIFGGGPLIVPKTGCLGALVWLCGPRLTTGSSFQPRCVRSPPVTRTPAQHRTRPPPFALVALAGPPPRSSVGARCGCKGARAETPPPPITTSTTTTTRRETLVVDGGSSVWRWSSGASTKQIPWSPTFSLEAVRPEQLMSSNLLWAHKSVSLQMQVFSQWPAVGEELVGRLCGEHIQQSASDEVCGFHGRRVAAPQPGRCSQRAGVRKRVR